MKPVPHNMVQIFGDLDDSEDDSDFDIGKFGGGPELSLHKSLFYI